MPFYDQEQFDTRLVEAITGIKSATLRQWEHRGIYTCELRRTAALELRIICAPDTPERLDKTAALLRRYAHGWRRYTVGDLIRLALILKLMEAGVEAIQAGPFVQGLYLPESDANSHPKGRELIRLLNPGPPQLPDEFLIFVLDQGDGTLCRPRPKAPSPRPKFLIHEGHELRDAIERMVDSSAAIIINLSTVRRELLKQLDVEVP